MPETLHLNSMELHSGQYLSTVDSVDTIVLGTSQRRQLQYALRQYLMKALNWADLSPRTGKQCGMNGEEPSKTGKV